MQYFIKLQIPKTKKLYISVNIIDNMNLLDSIILVIIFFISILNLFIYEPRTPRNDRRTHIISLTV